MKQAEFAKPAKGLIVPSAEGRRLGDSVRLIPTPKRLKRALDALTKRTSEGDHGMVEETIRERRFEIIGDTVSDHLPTFSADRDFVTCKCDGTVWEVPEWWRHVGREAVAALDEDADHYRTYSPDRLRRAALDRQHAAES